MASKLRLSVASVVTACATMIPCAASTAVCTLYAGRLPSVVRMKRASGSASFRNFSSAACTALGSITSSSCASAASISSRYRCTASRSATPAALLTARNFEPSIATHSPRTSPTSRANRARLPVHPPELGDRLVVRPQPPQQPHHFHVALTLRLQPPRRAQLVPIPIQVQLQQVPRIVPRPPRLRRRGAHKPQGPHL